MTYNLDKSFCDISRQGDQKLSSEHDNMQSTTMPRSQPGDSLQCQVCNRKFNTKCHYNVHVRIHTRERPFKCQCGKSFNRRNHLTQHKLTHTKVKPYKCDLCNNSYYIKGRLDRHRLTHSQVTFECNECGKKFNRRDCLVKHIKTLHTGTKKYTCDDCEKSFFQLYDLAVHQNSHKGVRLYECHKCDITFTTSSNLHRHKCFYEIANTKVSSNSTGENDKLRCDSCKNIFTRKCNLKRHKKICKVANWINTTALKCKTPLDNSNKLDQKSRLAIENKCSKSLHKKSNLTKLIRKHKNKEKHKKKSSKPVLKEVNGNRIAFVTKKQNDVGKDQAENNARSEMRVMVERMPLEYHVQEKGNKHKNREQSTSYSRSVRKKHTGPYECEECNRSFVDPVRQFIHELSHPEMKVYKCHNCCKFFRRKRSLRKHRCYEIYATREHNTPVTIDDELKMSESENLGRREKDVVKVSRRLKSRKAKEPQRNCEPRSYELFNWKISSQFKERDSNYDECDTENISHENDVFHEIIKYECTNCLKSFTSKRALRKHCRNECISLENYTKENTRIQSKLHLCDCGEKFADENQLISHQKSHEIVKTFKCFDCYETFSSLERYTQHNEIFHNGENPNILKEFDETVKDEHHDAKISQSIKNEDVEDQIKNDKHTSKDFDKHTHSNYSNIPKSQYQCLEHNKTFRTKTNETEASFKCTKRVTKRHVCECGESFAVYRKLLFHRKSHKAVTPYVCLNCCKKLSSKRNLERHQKTCKKAILDNEAVQNERGDSQNLSHISNDDDTVIEIKEMNEDSIISIGSDQLATSKPLFELNYNGKQTQINEENNNSTEIAIQESNADNSEISTLTLNVTQAVPKCDTVNVLQEMENDSIDVPLKYEENSSSTLDDVKEDFNEHVPQECNKDNAESASLNEAPKIEHDPIPERNEESAVQQSNEKKNSSDSDDDDENSEDDGFQCSFFNLIKNKKNDNVNNATNNPKIQRNPESLVACSESRKMNIGSKVSVKDKLKKDSRNIRHDCNKGSITAEIKLSNTTKQNGKKSVSIELNTKDKITKTESKNNKGNSKSEGRKRKANNTKSATRKKTKKSNVTVARSENSNNVVPMDLNEIKTDMETPEINEHGQEIITVMPDVDHLIYFEQQPDEPVNLVDVGEEKDEKRVMRCPFTGDFYTFPKGIAVKLLYDTKNDHQTPALKYEPRVTSKLVSNTPAHSTNTAPDKHLRVLDVIEENDALKVIKCPLTGEFLTVPKSLTVGILYDPTNDPKQKSKDTDLTRHVLPDNETSSCVASDTCGTNDYKQTSKDTDLSRQVRDTETRARVTSDACYTNNSNETSKYIDTDISQHVLPDNETRARVATDTCSTINSNETSQYTDKARHVLPDTETRARVATDTCGTINSNETSQYTDIARHVLPDTETRVRVATDTCGTDDSKQTSKDTDLSRQVRDTETRARVTSDACYTNNSNETSKYIDTSRHVLLDTETRACVASDTCDTNDSKQKLKDTDTSRHVLLDTETRARVTSDTCGTNDSKQTSKDTDISQHVLPDTETRVHVECDTCGTCFDGAHALARHWRGQLRRAAGGGAARYRCLCGRRFDKRRHLVRHLKALLRYMED